MTVEGIITLTVGEYVEQMKRQAENDLIREMIRAEVPLPHLRKALMGENPDRTLVMMQESLAASDRVNTDLSNKLNDTEKKLYSAISELEYTEKKLQDIMKELDEKDEEIRKLMAMREDVPEQTEESEEEEDGTEETEAEPEDPDAEDQSRARYDHGKIMALHDAKWPIEKIVEEVLPFERRGKRGAACIRQIISRELKKREKLTDNQDSDGQI